MLRDLELEYKIGNIMEKNFFIKDKIKEMIFRKHSFTKKMRVEISHHYGIDNFFEFFLLVLFHIINKEYIKLW